MKRCLQLNFECDRIMQIMEEIKIIEEERKHVEHKIQLNLGSHSSIEGWNKISAEGCRHLA